MNKSLKERDYLVAATEKGKAEGKAEGKVEGEQIGFNKAAREVAKKLLQKGIDLNEVAELTGLSVAELAKL